MVVQPPSIPLQEPPRRNTTVIVLSVIVGVLLVMMCLIAACAVFLFGDPYMFMSAEDEALVIDGEQMTSEVALLISAGDIEGLMDLYDSDDPHVDFSAVRRRFEAAIEASDTNTEYWADWIYEVEDTSTGDILVEVDMSGMDFDTGQSEGGRLTLYVVPDENRLTGAEGRDLERRKTLY